MPMTRCWKAGDDSIVKQRSELAKNLSVGSSFVPRRILKIQDLDASWLQNTELLFQSLAYHESDLLLYRDRAYIEWKAELVDDFRKASRRFAAKYHEYSN